MKRHERITIHRFTLIGDLVARSGWFDSGSIGRVALRSYEPSIADIANFSGRLSAMLGFMWSPHMGAIFGEFYSARESRKMKVYYSNPSPWLSWIDENATGKWLITDESDGNGATGRVWFQDETDVVLFRTAGFGTRL
jgi:hypothetical protein